MTTKAIYCRVFNPGETEPHLKWNLKIDVPYVAGTQSLDTDFLWSELRKVIDARWGGMTVECSDLFGDGLLHYEPVTFPPDPGGRDEVVSRHRKPQRNWDDTIPF